MRHVLIRGRKAVGGIGLVCFLVGFATIGNAQTRPRPQSPAPRTIILPPKVIAGGSATLAVLDSAGRLMPSIPVEISAGESSMSVTTDATGRALFVVPAKTGSLAAKIPGKEISASSAVVTYADTMSSTSANGVATESVAGELRVNSYPRVLSIHDRFAIDGAGFRGVADVNHVYLADQPCLVLASSPVSLVLLPGTHVPIGAMALRLSVAGYDAGPLPLVGVLLDFSGPTESPNAGAQGKLLLRVHGTDQPLSVEIRNASPGIVQLSGGNVQRVGTSGGDENIAQMDLKFLAAGDYTVTARLISEERN